jgi:hypothetical protein
MHPPLSNDRYLKLTLDQRAHNTVLTRLPDDQE